MRLSTGRMQQSNSLRSISDQSKTYCIVTPTYGNYASLASRYTNKLVCFDADPLSEFDVQAFAAFLTAEKVDLVFLANPDNPTGRYLNDEVITWLSEACPKTIFLLDQAYQEFVDISRWVPINTEANNIVYTRTLSKSFSLAGIRVGFLLAQKQIIEKSDCFETTSS